MNSSPAVPLNLITTEQIQKYLDENKNLIIAILENQNLGKMAECAQYQDILQKNLSFLAAIADAQPQESKITSKPPPSIIVPQENYHTLQNHASAPQQLGVPVPKLSFQVNAFQPKDHQNQFFKFQPQQQTNAHFSLGGGANNGSQLHMQPGGIQQGAFMASLISRQGSMSFGSFEDGK